VKPQSSSSLRSARIPHRHALQSRGRTLLARKSVTKIQPSDGIDLEKLLHFSQQLYAHALTLQEVIQNEGQVTYEVLRPRCERQAAQQFEIFYHTLKQPPDVCKRGAAAGE
jgi:hypothetical protein